MTPAQIAYRQISPDWGRRILATIGIAAISSLFTLLILYDTSYTAGYQAGQKAATTRIQQELDKLTSEQSLNLICYNWWFVSTHKDRKLQKPKL